MKIIIGFIENSEGQILVTRRALNTPMGGYWELPGGKIESFESPQAALVREIKEELNLDVLSCQNIAVLEDEYTFHLFQVTTWCGELDLLVGQLAYRWLRFEEISGYSFPKRNVKFFELWQKFRFLQSQSRC